MLVFHQRQWASWTHLSTIFSNELPPKDQDSPFKTRERPSHLGKSRLPSDFSCPVNWPNTLLAKEPKLWPSTPVPSNFSTNYSQTAFFKATHLVKTCYYWWDKHSSLILSELSIQNCIVYFAFKHSSRDEMRIISITHRFPSKRKLRLPVSLM